MRLLSPPSFLLGYWWHWRGKHTSGSKNVWSLETCGPTTNAPLFKRQNVIIPWMCSMPHWIDQEFKSPFFVLAFTYLLSYSCILWFKGMTNTSIFICNCDLVTSVKINSPFVNCFCHFVDLCILYSHLPYLRIFGCNLSFTDRQTGIWSHTYAHTLWLSSHDTKTQPVGECSWVNSLACRWHSLLTQISRKKERDTQRKR